MFGPRLCLARIFANRRMALWWAVSILFLTWQSAPSFADEGTGDGAEAAAPGAPPVAAAANQWAVVTAEQARP